MRFYSVIYAAIDDIEAALKGMLKPEYERSAWHRRGPRSVSFLQFGNIAGSIVRSVFIRRNAKARISRDGKIIGDNLTVRRSSASRTTPARSALTSSVVSVLAVQRHHRGDTIETFEMREKPRV